MPKTPGSVSKARPQSGVCGTVALCLQVCWQELGERGAGVDVDFPLKGVTGTRAPPCRCFTVMSPLPPPPLLPPPVSILREETRRSQVCLTCAILPHRQGGVDADKHLQEQALPQCADTHTHTQINTRALYKSVFVRAAALTSIHFPLLSTAPSLFLTQTSILYAI